MGFLDRLFGRAAPVEGKAFSQVQVSDLGAPNWSTTGNQQYAKEGYGQNIVVFRCVDYISRGMGIIPIKVMDVDGSGTLGEENDRHPLNDLLRQPNPYIGWSDWCAAVVAWRMITGNTFVQTIEVGGQPGELAYWSPIYMEPKLNSKGILVGWKYDDGKVKKTWDVDPVRPTDSELINWHTFKTNSHYTGMSPIQASAWSVDQHNFSSEWNASLLQNSAKPAGMLSIPGAFDEKVYTSLKEQIANQQTGPRNAGNVMIGSGGLDWKQFTINPTDMDWLGGRKMSATEIAQAYGLPPQLVGITESQTHANFEQARLQGWEEVILPLMDSFLDELNRWLVPKYKDKGVRLVMDRTDLPALVGRRREQFEMVQQASFMTTNEKRKAMGLEPLPEPEADQVLIPAGLLPLNLDVSLSEDEQVKQLMASGFTEEKAREWAHRVTIGGHCG